MKEWEKIYHTINNQKKVILVILLSDRVELRTKYILRDKYFKIISESNNQPHKFMPLITEFQNIWREVRIAKRNTQIHNGSRRKILGKSLYLAKNNTFLNNPWVIYESQRESRKYYKLNENENMIYQNLCETVKWMLWENFTALNVYIRREKSQINKLFF